VRVPQFRFYLFDVDGTLLDSAGDITSAVIEVFTRHGRGDAVSRDFLRGHIGLHLRATFETIFPEYDEDQMQAMVHEYREIYLGRNHKSTRVFPGVAEALARLGGQKATATTKGSETTGKVLELFGLRPYFDHVQGTDGFPHKPAPDVLLRAMEAMGATPAETLMVGDTPVDMEAARAAGVKLCAVRYGYGSTKIPEDVPDYWVNDLRELVPDSARASLPCAPSLQVPSDSA
jgi:HAD superfamily hydrolase (TIGR01509 family)